MVLCYMYDMFMTLFLNVNINDIQPQSHPSK